MKRTWSQANADEYGQLGIIESVRLRNFMCHDNLSFDFDPHMNFIVGRNGSGKSAVLTGIILALGGKSGSTGRFSNIKGFVKTGKNSASVSVTLKNCGPEAYKPDEYGEKITIERQFTSDGASGYKLKSEGGRIISTSKEDLTNILNVMDIQIENPITVLTQETSRNFLVSKGSKGDKLFKLFYEGTGLSRVDERYHRCVQESKDAKSELEIKKAVLPDMEKDIKSLKALLDRTAKINDLKKELLWAIVNKLEADRNAKVADLEKSQRDVSALTDKLTQREAEIADICQNLAAENANEKTSKAKMQAIRKELSELISKKSALEGEIREAQGTCSRHEREISKIETEISGLGNIMLEIKRKNQNDVDEDKIKYEMELQNLQNQITNTGASIGMVQSQKNSARKQIEGIQQEIDSCHAEIQEGKYELSRIMRDKQQLTDGMVNRLNVFGQEVINVKRDIEAGVKAGIFKKEPKGPIGLYINVKKPEWNFAVQECLKMSFLRTFLCDNNADAEQLSKIFAKHFQRQRPSIITSKFVSEVYDVTEYKCVTQYPTVFDMLHIEDPVIANCLIDQKQIENILLIDSPGEALNLMLYRPPEKCSFAYSINGDQFCHSPFRKYSCRNKNQFCLLKSVNEEDIRKKEEEIKLLNANLSKRVSDKAKLMKEIEVKKQELEGFDRDIMNKRLKLNQLSANLKDVKNSYSEPKDINILHTDLEELQTAKARHKEELDACKEALRSKEVERNILNKKICEGKSMLDEENTSFHSLNERLEGYQNRKEKLDSDVKKFKSQLAQIKPLLQEKEKDVENSNCTVKAATDRAFETCTSRIDTERSPDTIRHLLEETKKLLSRNKNQDREALFKQYEEKVAQFNKAKQDLARHEKTNKLIIKMLGERLREFREIRRNTSISLTCAFTTLLNENNFVGYPDFNFESQTLEIFAKPQKSNSKFGNKPNLSQLSGGERSYITIAFLLSLWDRICTPFRILDEYDVFMDSNNRHFSIHLLINAARLNKKIQYIFLSPLELPPIENSEHVKVHQMPDPRK